IAFHRQSPFGLPGWNPVRTFDIGVGFAIMLKLFRGGGGIGRRARLRGVWATVGVRVPPSAPTKIEAALHRAASFFCQRLVSAGRGAAGWAGASVADWSGWRGSNAVVVGNWAATESGSPAVAGSLAAVDKDCGWSWWAVAEGSARADRLPGCLGT